MSIQEYVDNTAFVSLGYVGFLNTHFHPRQTSCRGKCAFMLVLQEEIVINNDGKYVVCMKLNSNKQNYGIVLSCFFSF